LRTCWPIFRWASRRITHGPAIRPISSAVMAAITARKVMYWNTRRKPNSGDWDCSHWARLSSMAGLRLPLCLGHDGLDHAFHLHEPRSFDQHAGNLRQLRQYRGAERLYRVEMTALHRYRLVTQRQQLLDTGTARVL